MFSVEVPPWGQRSSALLRGAKSSCFVMDWCFSPAKLRG